MAQLVFDPVTGGITTIDSQTVLAVQSFLEANETITAETVPTLDDEDVFQCGKCKKQFTSLSLFMNHKKEQCLPLNADQGQEPTFPPTVSFPSATEASTASNLLLLKTLDPGKGTNYMVASTAGKQMAPFGSLVLSESDLLSLALDGSNLLPSLQSPASVADANTTTLVQSSNVSKQSEQIEGLSEHQSVNGVELSLLSNGILSNSGLYLASQAAGSGTTNLVLTFANPSVLRKEDLSLEVRNGSSKTGDAATNGSGVSSDARDASKSSTKPTSSANSKDAKTESSIGKKASRDYALVPKMSCKYCEKRFSKNFDLQQHIRSHTGEKPFQCIICGRAFAQKSNVKKHIQTHKVWPNGLSSTLPSSVATAAATTLQAVDKRAKENQSPSDTSGDSRNGPPDVADDNNSSSIDNSYVCPYCPYFGKTYLELKGHMKEHKNEKVFKCILASCAKLFEDLDAYLDHVKSHDSEITYHCHMCSKVFQSLYDLGVHQYLHNPSSSKPMAKFKKTFQCSSCLNKYSTQAALDHHMATSPHNYPCPHCEKRFPCERYLRRHLLVHSTRSNVICPICSKTFKGEHYLRIHNLIHTGEKPFTCPHCGTSFNRNDKLKRHLLIHEPLKRFKCPFRKHSGCLKEFNRPDKLKAHVLTHGKSKPFFCRTCGRSFMRKAQYNAHQAQHQQEKNYPFHCTQCGSGFLDKEVYDTHTCVQFPARKWRTDGRYQRPTRSRRSKFSLPRPHKKLKKQVPEEETVVAAEEPILVDDGIPTAHIEIISTTGDLGQVSELSQISLQLHQLVEAPNKEDVQSTVIQNLPLVPMNYELHEVISTDSSRTEKAEAPAITEPEITID